MCREIESACKGNGRECVFREREREGECTERERKRERGGKMESVCREREGVCREIESACKGNGRECVFREREREREKEGERGKDGKCVQREGRSVF